MTALAYRDAPFLGQLDDSLSVPVYPVELLATGLLVLPEEALDLEPAPLGCPREGCSSCGSLQVTP